MHVERQDHPGLRGAHERRRGARRLSRRRDLGAVPTFEAFCEGPVWAHFESRKPSTQRSVRWMLKGCLLPAFGPLPLDRITSAAVHRWFDEYSRTAPGGANCVLSVLRNILNQAVNAG